MGLRQGDEPEGSSAHGEADATTPTLGLRADPGVPQRIAARIADDLAEQISEAIGAPWRVEIAQGELPLSPDGTIPVLDGARELLEEQGWEFLLYLTDLPRHTQKGPVVCEIGADAGAALISLPPLGALGVARRTRQLAAYCESYGRDLVTGAPLEPTEYKALNPEGKAILKSADYYPAHEVPSGDFPLHVITGRTIYHFHTRTKTGRVPELQSAAPEVWVELSAADAEAAGIAEGDLVRIATPRGGVQAAARITGIRSGVVFLPFHYGYWDGPGGFEPADGDGTGTAANELTMTDWDPASKQPLFKTAAGRIERITR